MIDWLIDHPFPGCKGYDFSLRPYEWGSSPNCIPWEGWRADINFLMQTLFAQLTKMVQSLRRQLIRLDAWISAQNPQNSRDMQIMSSKIQSGSHFCPILLPGSWVYEMEHFIAISSFVWVDFSTRIAPWLNAEQNKLLNFPHLPTQVNFPYPLNSNACEILTLRCTWKFNIPSLFFRNVNGDKIWEQKITDKLLISSICSKNTFVCSTLEKTKSPPRMLNAANSQYQIPPEWLFLHLNPLHQDCFCLYYWSWNEINL